MSQSLKEISEQLDIKLQESREETLKELATVNASIDELNALLQTKEMNTDRSENASFQIAKDARDIKVSVRSKLQKRLATLEAGSGTYVPTGIITLGTTVEFSVITIDGKPPAKPIKMIVKLVEDSIAKAKLGFIAVGGKVGAAFVGKQSGQEVIVRALKGDILYKIERIY